MQHYIMNDDGDPEHGFVHRGPFVRKIEGIKTMQISPPDKTDDGGDVFLTLPKNVNKFDSILQTDGKGNMRSMPVPAFEWQHLGPLEILDGNTKNVGPIDVLKQVYMNKVCGPVLAVLPHPEKANVIYCATIAGIWKTFNGKDPLNTYINTTGGIKSSWPDVTVSDLRSLEPHWQLVLDHDPNYRINFHV